MKRFDMMQTAKKLTRFLKSHFPLSSSYHFLYGVLAVFLIYNGFSLEPVLNAHRGLVVMVALVSLLPLILIPRFCGKKILGWQRKLDGVWNVYRFDGRGLLRVVGDTSGTACNRLCIGWYFV